MDFVKVLDIKEMEDRKKVLFGINRKATEKNDFDIKVIIDDCRISDINFPTTFSTFIIVSEGTPRSFAGKFIRNARTLPGLVGMIEPGNFATAKYRTLIQMGNKKDYSEEKLKGGITEEISFDEMLNDDYTANIYNDFSQFLSDANEMI